MDIGTKALYMWPKDERQNKHPCKSPSVSSDYVLLLTAVSSGGNVNETDTNGEATETILYK